MARSQSKMTSAKRHEARTTGKSGQLALSVVVPCFNEEQVLPELYRRLTDVCVQAVENAYEIILVDDGSADRTREHLKTLAEQDERVVVVVLSRNYGHQIALTAGFHQAGGDRILILDADLQDPPELLGKMMALMDDGHDVVYGQRVLRRGESAVKRASASIFYRIISKLSQVEIPRDTGDFRLINRRALDALLAMPEQHRYIRGMISWIGLRQCPIKYERDPRFDGTSKYPIGKLLTLAASGITSFSILPLRFATAAGLVTSLLSLILMLYALASWITGHAVPGWTSVFMAVLFLGGLQMVMIGIVGEYVGRIYMEGKRRPLYILDEVIRHKNREPADS